MRPSHGGRVAMRLRKRRDCQVYCAPCLQRSDFGLDYVAGDGTAAYEGRVKRALRKPGAGTARIGNLSFTDFGLVRKGSRQWSVKTQ